MRARTWAIFIGVNIVVSALVMLTILFIWNRRQAPTAPTPTATRSQPATGEASPPPGNQPPVSPTAPGPIVYTVRSGDTLGAIAQTYNIPIGDLMAVNGLTDPNVLQVGQTLIIPTVAPLTPTAVPPAQAPSETPSAETVAPPEADAGGLPTPLPTLTPSGPPLIEIGQVLGSDNLAAEVVIVRNRGGAISLDRWTLSDTEGNIYVFPALTLFADTEVRIHTAEGTPTPSDLYWGRTSAAWDGGELLTLRDAADNVVDTYIVP